MVIPTLDPTQEYAIISGIITAVGRNIILTYVTSRAACTVCNGTDPFCTTCNGNPTTDTTTTRTVLADVHWRSSDKKLYFPEGQDPDGDCWVSFLITTQEMYELTDSLLKNIVTVLVDNRECVVNSWVFKGNPINRVNLILSQQADVGGQRIG